MNKSQTISFGTARLPMAYCLVLVAFAGRRSDLLAAALAMRVGYWAGQVLREVSEINAPVIFWGVILEILVTCWRQRCEQADIGGT
jgi:hypothetical protein